MSKFPRFELPLKPYSVTDAINRSAVATGSPRMAQEGESSNYNGHHLTLDWNEFRGYYIVQYWWAGRRVLTRTADFQAALQCLKSNYNSQGRGASATIAPHTEDDLAICQADPDLLTSQQAEAKQNEWYTWKHGEAGWYVQFYAKQGIPVSYLLEATSKEDYEARIKAHWAARRK